jgi:hypothetical protein
MEPLFIFEHGQYLPTDWARGPWDIKLLHGGPPAALLAHALDAERREELWTTRMTIDLLRPVRLAPLSVRTQVVRKGKRIQLVDAFLHEADDTLVARASGLMLRRNDNADDTANPPQQKCTLPSWETLAPLALGDDGEDRLFHRGTEFRPVRHTDSGELFAVWIRIPYALLPDRPLGPLAYAAAISDYVNAVGSMATPSRHSFINADINLSLHREPVGDWLCLESLGRPAQAGIATSNVNLHDALGLLGSVSASCLANPMPPAFAGKMPTAG